MLTEELEPHAGGAKSAVEGLVGAGDGNYGRWWWVSVVLFAMLCFALISFFPSFNEMLKRL